MRPRRAHSMPRRKPSASKSPAARRTSEECPTRKAALGLWVILLIATSASEASASSYDSLAALARVRPAHLDLTAHDAKRGRDIPLRVYLPTNTAPAPVILFSHGLGGSRMGSAF